MHRSTPVLEEGLPITFLKDRDDGTDTAVDRSALRERYIADGRRVAGRLALSEDVRAVWLSGPFSYPRIKAASDLHMGVLTGGEGGHYYYHTLPHFSEVGRRLEIAFFPVDHFEALLERGCASWTDVYDCDKLSDIVILFERDGILSGMRRRLDALRPARMFVGIQIEALKSESAAAGRSLAASRWGEGALDARKLARSALRLLLVAGRGRLFSKPAHLYSALKGHVPPAQAAGYEHVHGIAELDEGNAARIVEACSDAVRYIYGRQGVCAAD
jgi:hypothetical protein